MLAPPMADDLLMVPWKYTPLTVNLKPPLRLMSGPRPIRQLLITRMSWIVSAVGHSNRAVVVTLEMRLFHASRTMFGLNPGCPDRYKVRSSPVQVPLFGATASAAGAVATAARTAAPTTAVASSRPSFVEI